MTPLQLGEADLGVMAATAPCPQHPVMAAVPERIDGLGDPSRCFDIDGNKARTMPLVAEELPLAPTAKPPPINFHGLIPCVRRRSALCFSPGSDAAMPSYWISLFSRKTYKEWRDAGSPPEGCFPEGARGRVGRMAKGDVLLCYLSSPDSAFVGVQEVTGAMRDGGSVVWGNQFPLTLPVTNLAFLEPEEAIRYLSLDFLPTMAGREAGRLVPSRGRVGQSGNSFPPAEGAKVVEAILKLARVSREIEAVSISPASPAAPAIPLPDPPPSPSEATISEAPAETEAQDQAAATEHQAAQALLIKLGRKLGLDVWVTLLHGYAKPLKRLNISESVSRHKCLILLDSCWIHATRCLGAVVAQAPRSAPRNGV